MTKPGSRSQALRQWFFSALLFVGLGGRASLSLGRKHRSPRKTRPRPPFRLPLAPRHSVLVFAHRGYSGRFPENTMLAFRKAIEVEADLIEIDVTLSQDGRVVVFHDDTVDRTTSGSGAIRSLSWAQIGTLDAGSWFSREYQGERVPSLEEVLDLVEGRAGLNIEIKPEVVTQDDVRGIEALCVEAVRKRRLSRNVIFSSFSPVAIGRIKRLAPEMATALLTESPHRGMPIRSAVELEASALHADFKRLNRKIVEKAHEAGLPVYAFTLNHTDDFEKALEWGIDGIFTDYPEMLQHFLERRATRREPFLFPDPIRLAAIEPAT